MITEKKFATTDSADARLIMNSKDEMHFDTHARVKSVKDSNLVEDF